MTVTELAIPGVLLLTPRRFHDSRGWFFESWHGERYAALGIGAPFVQDNVSVSQRGVLRGLHFQQPHSQGKLVSVLQGAVFDVAVDVRIRSPTFGQWIGVELSDADGRQLWVPPGFAHGFVVLSERATFAYKCTDYYTPSAERSVRWDDPALGIDWPEPSPVLSDKDATAPTLAELPPELLPPYL